MPMAVYSIGVSLKRDKFIPNTMANRIDISTGVTIEAYGEAKFDSWGVLLQLGAVAFEATQLLFATEHKISISRQRSIQFLKRRSLVMSTVE